MPKSWDPEPPSAPGCLAKSIPNRSPSACGGEVGGACCSAGAGPTVTLLSQPGDCYSNRVTACPVDIPNPSLWPQAALGYDPTVSLSSRAGAACPHPHLPALGTPGSWGESSTGPPKAISLHPAPAPWRVRATLMPERLCHPATVTTGFSTAQSLGVLFCPMRRAGESWTHSSFITTPPEPRTAPVPHIAGVQQTSAER